MIAILDKIKHLDVVQLVKTSMRLICFMVLVAVVVAVTNTKLQTLKVNNEVYRQGFVSATERTKQLECMTRNIYYEAATEPFEGKVAVAQVTMNRLEDGRGRFGRDVCSVVYQKNIIYEKVVCQFSWTCDGVSRVKPIYAAHYRESEEVAKKVLLENFRLPSMKDAMYYHADYVNPRWGKPQVAKIGRHIFYRENQ
jgi:spore germination cell wall hydrolase CwlJ-like protein